MEPDEAHDDDDREPPWWGRRFWRMLVEINERLIRIERLLHRHPATRYTLTISGVGGHPMQIADNDTTHVASVTYVDAAGHATADDGATVAYGSSDPSIASIDASTGAITPAGIGTATISATVTNSDGSTLPGNTVDVEIVAGPAATFNLTVA